MEGMHIPEANQISELLDIVGHEGDCDRACGAMGGLEEYKQALVDANMFELLRDLKVLEDAHDVHIPYKDLKGIRCCATDEIRFYSCCGRRV